MINRYRRQARTWAELGLGRLAPLDEAIPELAGPIAPLLPHAGQSVRGPIVANLAEREGFEPSVPLRVHMISKLRAIMGILARSRKQA